MTFEKPNFQPMKYIYSLLLLMVFYSSLDAQDLYESGQKKSVYLTHADTAFVKGDYYTAYSFYKEAYLYDTSDVRITYRTAEAARYFEAYGESEKYYSEVLNAEGSDQYPECAFWLANMQQRQGKYNDAAINYKLYLSEHEGEDLYKEKRSKMQLAACEWAQSALDDPRADIKLSHLGMEVNTPYSEIGGILSGSDMYYTSLRFKRLNENGEEDRLRSKILKQKEDEIPEIIEELNNDNSVWAAHTTFGNKGNTMYFTLCDYVDEMDIRCEIYYRVKENEKWGTAVKLPAQINIDSFTATDPAIAYNAKLDKEVLYFVSDRDDGKGKKDIWYTIVDKNMNFSQPMNLSGVNTIEDDISPFYDNNKNTLYFSSEGYRGMGGFDVYKTYLGGNGWDGVIHMGAPLNSSYNDIYYTMSEDGSKGLLASNRLGSYYLDNKPKACCYDLYSVDIQPCDILLDIFTFDADTKDSLREVTVTIHDTKRGEDKKIKILEKDIAKFQFPIECSRSYEITAEREGYFPASIKLSTPKPGIVTTISRNMYQKPKTIALKVLVYNQDTGKPLKGVEVKLMMLPDTLMYNQKINKDSNDFYFKPSVCYKYQIIGTKKGFIKDEYVLDLPCNTREDQLVKLYLEPYLTGILPLVLYFDNDHPNPKTYGNKTKATYSETFLPYYAKKDEYKSNYVEDGEEEYVKRIDSFFNEKLKGGQEQLQEFLEILLLELGKNKKYEIILMGFASPSAASSYNKALGARRIQSVRNEFSKYSNNKISKYLRNGQLKISERSYGEEKAPKNISDDYKDRKKSVYSVEASEQRKVEIVEVKNNN